MTLPNGWRKWSLSSLPNEGTWIWYIAFSGVTFTAFVDKLSDGDALLLAGEDPKHIIDVGDIKYWQPYSVPAGPDDVIIAPVDTNGMDLVAEMKPHKQLWMLEV